MKWFCWRVPRLQRGRGLAARHGKTLRGVFRQNAANPQLPRVRPNQVAPWISISNLISSQYPQVRSIAFAPAEVRPTLQLPTLTSLSVNVEVA